jgi:hypothetical protein
MERWLAIVAYRCEVAGEPTDSIDIQVRYLRAEFEEDIESQPKAQPICSYDNEYGELVTWPLVGMLAAAPFSHEPDGSEVVGFITGCHEFVKWALANSLNGSNLDQPRNSD